MEINIHEAKTHLSKLIKRVEAGESVTISRAGVPIADLVAHKQEPNVRPIGIGKGSFWISDDFDAPMPDEWLKTFYEAPFTTPSIKGPKKRKKKK